MATKKAVPSRAEEFCNTGAKLASKIGIVNVTRRAIAEAHSVSDPLVGKHVGGKAELQAGIKKAMKKLGLTEPAGATIERKGAELRARKPVAAKKAAPAKKSTGRGSVPVSAAKSKKTAAAKKPAAPVKPADPKKGAPARKVVKKAPSNKKFGGIKVPPLPAIPNA
ncbi:hypothetical protein CPT_Silvanus_044 [Stenotrophomonas phage Silvanus]|nr:hypothetical protein CPT_Silvanus_044 [Stenotrophomonas phage Silvanus]